MNPLRSSLGDGLAVRLLLPRLRMRRRSPVETQGRASAALRYQRVAPQTSLVRFLGDSGGSPCQGILLRYQGITSSDFSGGSKLPPSTAASGSVFVRARARARTNTHGCTLNQTVPRSALGQTMGLSAHCLPSLLAHSLLTRSSSCQLSSQGRHPYGVTPLLLGWHESSLYRTWTILTRIVQQETVREAHSSAAASGSTHRRTSVLILNPKS